MKKKYINEARLKKESYKVKIYGDYPDGEWEKEKYNSKGLLVSVEKSDGYLSKREYDSNNNEIYYENSDGYWSKYEYDSNGNNIYFENSEGSWSKSEYDSNNNLIYWVNSDGQWEKYEYDSNNNEIYGETSTGYFKDNRNLSEARLKTLTDKERETLRKKGFNSNKITKRKEIEDIINNLPTIYYFNASFKPIKVGEQNGEIIYKKRLDIEKFLKLDPNDQQNSHTISMMKMRTRFQPELNTYIVTTTKDLLDDYVGKGGNDFPDDILKSIQEKMKKL